MLRLRKILFISFTLAYIVICPLVIMYALGIVIKPGTGRRPNVVKTGIISISSIPSGAFIYINNELSDQRTPAVINNLPAGEYTIKLMLKDYKKWQGTIPVIAEKVTLIKNILLFPQEWKRSIVATTFFEELRAFPGNTFLLLRGAGDQLKDISIYIWDEGLKTLISSESAVNKAANLRPLLTGDIKFPEAKLVHIYSADNSPFLLFEGEITGQKKFLWVDPVYSTAKVEDVTDLLPLFHGEIFWDPQDSKNLFTIQADFLSRLNLGLKSFYPHIIDRVQSVALYNQNIYVLTLDAMFERYDRDGTIQQSPVDDPQLTQALFKNKTIVRINVLSDDLILFLTEQGELICNRLPYRLVEKGVKNFRYDRKNQQLLVWTDRDLGWIDFSRKSEVGTFERGPLLNWVVNNANFVRDAFWVNDGASLLYLDRDTVMITDKGLYGLLPPEPVVTVKKNSHISYSDKSGELFFLKDPEGYLTTAEILPARALLPARESGHKITTKTNL